ncbi:hypothetical protein EDD11_004153 [Mortierella claussenii]|nr:hypothetical protein EDD11_004153 [Mortierella claussenii]
MDPMRLYEILTHVMQFLDTPSLHSCNRVSHFWRTCARHITAKSGHILGRDFCAYFQRNLPITYYDDYDYDYDDNKSHYGGGDDWEDLSPWPLPDDAKLRFEREMERFQKECSQMQSLCISTLGRSSFRKSDPSVCPGPRLHAPYRHHPGFENLQHLSIRTLFSPYMNVARVNQYFKLIDAIVRKNRKLHTLEMCDVSMELHSWKPVLDLLRIATTDHGEEIAGLEPVQHDQELGIQLQQQQQQPSRGGQVKRFLLTGDLAFENGQGLIDIFRLLLEPSDARMKAQQERDHIVQVPSLFSWDSVMDNDKNETSDQRLPYNNLEELELRNVYKSGIRNEENPPLNLHGLLGNTIHSLATTRLRSLTLLGFKFWTPLYTEWSYEDDDVFPTEGANDAILALLHRCPLLEHLCISFDSTHLDETIEEDYATALRSVCRSEMPLDTPMVIQQDDFVTRMQELCPRLKYIHFGLMLDLSELHWVELVEQYRHQLEGLVVHDVQAFSYEALLLLIGPPLSPRLDHSLQQSPLSASSGVYQCLAELNISGIHDLRHAAWMVFRHVATLKVFKARSVVLDATRLVGYDWVCHDLEVLEVCIMVPKQNYTKSTHWDWVWVEEPGQWVDSGNLEVAMCCSVAISEDEDEDEDNKDEEDDDDEEEEIGVKRKRRVSEKEKKKSKKDKKAKKAKKDKKDKKDKKSKESMEGKEDKEDKEKKDKKAEKKKEKKKMKQNRKQADASKAPHQYVDQYGNIHHAWHNHCVYDDNDDDDVFLNQFGLLTNAEKVAARFHREEWHEFSDSDSDRDSGSASIPVHKMRAKEYHNHLQIQVCGQLGRLTKLRRLRLEGDIERDMDHRKYGCLELTLETGLDRLWPLQQNLETLIVNELEEKLAVRPHEADWIARNWIHHNNPRWLQAHPPKWFSMPISDSTSSVAPRNEENVSSSSDHFLPCPKFKELLGVSTRGADRSALSCNRNMAWLKEQCPLLDVVEYKDADDHGFFHSAYQDY